MDYLHRVNGYLIAAGRPDRAVEPGVPFSDIPFALLTGPQCRRARHKNRTRKAHDHVPGQCTTCRPHPRPRSEPGPRDWLPAGSVLDEVSRFAGRRAGKGIR